MNPLLPFPYMPVNKYLQRLMSRVCVPSKEVDLLLRELYCMRQHSNVTYSKNEHDVCDKGRGSLMVKYGVPQSYCLLLSFTIIISNIKH
jgi:hypothetical protein